MDETLLACNFLNYFNLTSFSLCPKKRFLAIQFVLECLPKRSSTELLYWLPLVSLMRMRE